MTRSFGIPRRLALWSGTMVALAALVAPSLQTPGVLPLASGPPPVPLSDGRTLARLLADPFTPAAADPAVLAQLGSTGSPEDDLAHALDDLGAAGDAAAATQARQRALDILEGNPLAEKAYSGMPLLNWNGPAKVKSVSPGGTVTVNEVRFGQHTISDTAGLDFVDPNQPFSITYRIAELGTSAGGLSSPTPLLVNGAAPAPSRNAVVAPLVLPSLLTGTNEVSRFAPDGGPEVTRLGVQQLTVPMPAPKTMSVVLDPSLRPGHPSFTSVEAVTPDRLAALRAAFGFSGPAPTAAQRDAAIGRLGDAAPEKLIWSDLRRLAPGDPAFLAAAKGVGQQDRQLVGAMRSRTQAPPGTAVDPGTDLTVILVNDEAYISRPAVQFPAGEAVRVTVRNLDGFTHRLGTVDIHTKQGAGPLDWGQFAWTPLPAPQTLAAGASTVVTLTPAADSFGLWLGDADLGDQATQLVPVQHGPRAPLGGTTAPAAPASPSSPGSSPSSPTTGAPVVTKPTTGPSAPGSTAKPAKPGTAPGRRTTPATVLGETLSRGDGVDGALVALASDGHITDPIGAAPGAQALAPSGKPADHGPSMLGLVKLALAALLLLGFWLLWSRHGRSPAVEAGTGEEPPGAAGGDRP